MDSIILLYVILGVLFVVIIIVIAVVSAHLSQKRLDDIVSELHLVHGEYYDVITNNGNTQKDLIFDRIAYGNNSKNGNVNLYFIKYSKYRGTSIQKEVMIKYGNVWKIISTSGKIVTQGDDDISNQQDELNTYIDELNAKNTYSDKIGIIQSYIAENYKSLTPEEIYKRACEINSYERPVPYCVVHLHYALSDIIDHLYKLRDVDKTTFDYCLLICDMDIALYDDVHNAIMKESKHDFVYAASLSRKIIILEKLGRYQEAIDMCDYAITHEYLSVSGNCGPSTFIAQKTRIMKKLSKKEQGNEQFISKTDE